MSTSGPSLRERTRRAVQREIGEAALALFVARGYEATTIDDIAAAVGMSQRSVFRYFATKEEIVVGKFALGTEDMLEALRARPLDEPVWASLRRLFDVVDAPGHDAVAPEVQRVVLETPALLAFYLQRLQHLQEGVVAVLVERAAQAGVPYAPDDPTPRVLTAAAFGCLVAAQRAWVGRTTDASLADGIDRAMAVLAPTAGGRR